MSKLRKKEKIQRFQHYLTPEYLVTCSDAVIGQDQGVSLIRLIDQVTPLALPIPLLKFTVVAQFQRNCSIPIHDLLKAGLVHKLLLATPEGDETQLAEFSLAAIDPHSPWFTTRSIVDLSSQLMLTQEGDYKFKLMGRTKDSEFEELAVKVLPVRLSTGMPGIYSVEFFTNDKQGKKWGAGFVALLGTGKIQGRDHGYSYDGSYKTDNGYVQAELKIRRLDSKVESIFGNLEEFELVLKGKVNTGPIILDGHIKSKPSRRISIKLQRQLNLQPSQKL